MSPGARLAGKHRICGLHARARPCHQLSAATAIQSSRATTWRTPGHFLAASRENPARRPPGGATRRWRTACRAAARRLRSASCRAPSRVRRADRAAGRPGGLWCVWRSGALRRRAAVRGFLGKLAEGERAAAVEHESVAGLAFVGADVPAVGGGSDQHRTGDRGGLAHRLLERADRGRSGGNSAASSLSISWRAASRRRPASPSRSRADWHRNRSAGPARPQLSPTPRRARRRRSAAARSRCPGRSRLAARRR